MLWSAVTAMLCRIGHPGAAGGGQLIGMATSGLIWHCTLCYPACSCPVHYTCKRSLRTTCVQSIYKTGVLTVYCITDMVHSLILDVSLSCTSDAPDKPSRSSRKVIRDVRLHSNCKAVIQPKLIGARQLRIASS